MSSAGVYKVEIYSSDGRLKSTITDYKTLQIVDIANNSGMWKISCTSKNECPFVPADLVMIYRNNHYIYGGIFTQSTEEYKIKYHAWQWTASGVGFNQVLKERIVVPPLGSSRVYLDERELNLSDTAPNLLKYLIQNYTQYNYNTYEGMQGIIIVRDVILQTPISGTETYEISARFDNLYDIVSGLASAGNIYILQYPIHTEYSSYNYIGFAITSGNDLTDDVIFDSENGQINSFSKSITRPPYTAVLANYNSDDIDPWSIKPIWQTFRKANTINANWELGYWGSCVFYKPKKEDFVNGIDGRELDRICEKEAKAQPRQVYCYEIEINPILSPYSYGYDYDTTTSKFTTDYRIGDKIKIIVDGETFTGTITGMEFYSAYEKEYIKPTIGDLQKGSFNNVISNINLLNKSVTNTDNTAV